MSIEPDEGYRLLTDGEVILEGDEFLMNGANGVWMPVRGTIRAIFNTKTFFPTRRKVEVESHVEPKTPDCPFEVGKEYPMRGGGVFRVYATDAGGPKPIHGATKCSDGWAGGSRTVDGCMYADRAESAFDIILPKPIADDAWPDWVPEGAWYVRDKNGDSWVYDDEPTKGKLSWKSAVDMVDVNHWPFDQTFPYPPADLPWDQTKCQKPKRKNNESI